MPARIPTSNLGLPGHVSPAAGFEAPFDMLTACHERVERTLGLLARLRDYLGTNGWDPTAADAARDVMRYFDLAAPHHHEDEERHVFPAALASPDTVLHAAVHRLQQDHIDMTHAWQAARTVLTQIRDTPYPAPGCGLTEADTLALTGFAALYDRHIETEETLVYPGARERLTPDGLQAMGADMMARRQT